MAMNPINRYDRTDWYYLMAALITGSPITQPWALRRLMAGIAAYESGTINGGVQFDFGTRQ
jgi:hypothetical protein